MMHGHEPPPFFLPLPLSYNDLFLWPLLVLRERERKREENPIFCRQRELFCSSSLSPSGCVDVTKKCLERQVEIGALSLSFSFLSRLFFLPLKTTREERCGWIEAL